MSKRLIMVAALCFGLTSCAVARDPQLELPDFTHLRGKATESIDLSFGSFSLFIARRFVGDDDPQGAAVKDLLQGVRKVHLRHYEFADDFVYAKSDLDRVRAELTARGCKTLAHVRDNRNSEDVDICAVLDAEEITGFAIVVSEPREFTIINVVGKLELQKVAALRAAFASDDGGSALLGRPQQRDAASADVQSVAVPADESDGQLPSL